MKESLNDKYIYYLCFRKELEEKYGIDIFQIIEELDNSIISSINLAISILGAYSYMIENNKKDNKNTIN